jgi:hypothetical protein
MTYADRDIAHAARIEICDDYSMLFRRELAGPAGIAQDYEEWEAMEAMLENFELAKG